MEIKFVGNSAKDLAEQAREFADQVLGKLQSPSTSAKKGSEEGSPSSHEPGYQPPGVGSPRFCPVDDGSEWDEDAVRDWLERLTPEGRIVVKTLAKGKIIDPRKQADVLHWDHIRWAGVWTGPRRQSREVATARNLDSWPYGHTYEEPRRMWMHEEIANKVLGVLEELEN